VSDLAALETDHITVVGRAGTLRPDLDPPRLYAEETYTVRPRVGASMGQGVLGVLTVLPGAHEGRLRFGNFVGLADVDGLTVRVDSRKISAPEADQMIRQLVTALSSLPSRALTPTGQAFDRPLAAAAAEVDLIAYLVVRDAINGRGPHDLTAAMARILERPHERLTVEQIEKPVWAADRIDSGTLIDLVARSGERIRVPTTSPLAAAPITARLHGTLPAHLRVTRSTPTTDTLENRFIATVVDHCLAIVRRVAAHAARDQAPGMKPLRDEAQQLAAALERWRRHRVLETLQPITQLPTTSTVLRGRRGYRHVLQLYADLIGRPRLIPPQALMRIVGVRDIATLYEWWCLFELIDATAATLGPPLKIVPASEGWQGAELGQGLRAEFPLGVRIDFNRSFSRSKSGNYRSYSVALRPDLLLETPLGRHIFDAKFAFDVDTPLANDEDEGKDEDEDDGGDSSTARRARRWHIHKMHTYRDALHGVASVRVLYPGSKVEWYPIDPGDQQHGVGAVPLSTGNEGQGRAFRTLVERLLSA
jgi:predicted component of viral defense system (DUF524 family)